MFISKKKDCKIFRADPPVWGATQTYTVRWTAPNAPAGLLFAAGRSSPTDLGNGCTLHVPVGAAIAVAAGSTDASGVVSYTLTIPNDPALIGAEVTVQAFIADPGGPALGVGDLTNAVELCIGF